MNTNTLLVVDDEAPVLTVLKNFLERERTFESRFADCAETAIEMFKERPVDLVLTDLKMPGKSGLDLVKEIKEIDSKVQVIVMSGYGDVEDVITALRMGVVDYFQKPFRMQTVLDCIRRTFDRIEIQRNLTSAKAYVVEERKHLRIPNNFEAAHQVTMELTQNLVRNGFSDESHVESIRVALTEIITNAIEHGNLGVTYEQKNERIDNYEEYRAFLRERSEQPDYRERVVEIIYTMKDNEAKFVITDQGEGFDHSTLPDPTDPENLLNSHGRGILMTRIYMDELYYNDTGNQAILIKRKV